MSRKLKIYSGRRFGKFRVIDRGPDFEGEADTRVQWWLDCGECNQMFLKVARDLERLKSVKCKMCDYVFTKEITQA